MKVLLSQVLLVLFMLHQTVDTNKIAFASFSPFLLLKITAVTAFRESRLSSTSGKNRLISLTKRNIPLISSEIYCFRVAPGRFDAKSNMIQEVFDTESSLVLKTKDSGKNRHLSFLRPMYRADDSIMKQREDLNAGQINRELIYTVIKKKIRASSYDFGTQNVNGFFSRFDVDRDGYLDLSEFQYIIRQLGIHPDKLSLEEIRIIWQEINANGIVSVHEFMHWLDSSGKTHAFNCNTASGYFNRSAWTYGENNFASKPPYPGNLALMKITGDTKPLHSISFINSLVDSCEHRVSAVSYFLINEIGIPVEKLASIALKYPEVFNLDVESSLKSLLNDMLNLGIPTQRLAKMALSFPALLSTSRERREAILRCLEDLGLSPERVAKCISLHPQLLALSVEEKISPTVRFLVEECSIPRSALSGIVSAVPSVLGLSVDKNLRPKFDFLQEELHLPRAKAATLVVKFPQFLCLSLSNNIIPTLRFLGEELGIPAADRRKMLEHSPQLLGLNVDKNLRCKVAFLVEQLGVPREQVASLALQTCLCLS